jgi:hypothetical protein
MKGALVVMSPGVPASALPFQYNPDTVTRRLEPRAVGGDGQGDRSEALRLLGPPKETISLTIEIDATDQLEQGEVVASSMGIHPALASFELLLYPPSVAVMANLALAKAGNIEIIPPEAPLLVLVWGQQRVVPVRIGSLSITEEAHDERLNPLRAKIELSLTVLSYMDLPVSHAGHDMFMAQQVAKEALAARHRVPAASLNLPLSVKPPF